MSRATGAWRQRGFDAFSAGLAVGLCLSAPSLGQQPQPTHILILAPELEDGRIASAREAIAFWNRTFAEFDLEPALADAEVVVSSPATRALETYARLISTGAGRLEPSPFEPDPPTELSDLDAEVVLLLSRQQLMPFSWPLPRSSRYFIAVSGAPETAVQTRNVIAHELGHVLGLSHHPDPSSLMCLPCGATPADLEGTTAFRPLLASDRARLRELYSQPAD